MLKKIALAGLFAITFAVGLGAAQAATNAEIKAAISPAPHGLCPLGCRC